MSIGTKSLLYGYHQFIIHPLLVAWSWCRLYGFPCDPRLWVAFVVHDWGYLGKPNMDGPEGEQHVVLGARIMGILFGYKWAMFCASHSRFWSYEACVEPSKLCWADKRVIASTPTWFQIMLMRLTGEINEYKEHNGDNGDNGRTPGIGLTDVQFVDAMRQKCAEDVAAGLKNNSK